MIDLLYPPRCFHCKESMAEHARLCPTCVQLLTLLSPEGRCEKCFGSIATITGVCESCRQLSHCLQKFGACFDAYGPAQTLLNAFLHGHRDLFVKEIASFFVVQLDALRFPPCDLITLVPQFFSRRKAVIAKEVARLLGAAFEPVLKRVLSETPQFRLKSRCNIINKRVLLLDANTKTRSTIRSAARALADGWPETIHGMSFCAT